MGWSRFFRRGRWDEVRAKELQAYLNCEIDDNLARGMSADDARRAAYLKLGNPTLIRERIYSMNSFPFVDGFLQDLRYGLRLLIRNPTFSIVAILTLALGTGANAAIFQLVNSVRLRSLPVDRPEELVSIGINTHDKGRIGRFMGRRPYMSEPLWQAVRAQQHAFSHVFVWGTDTWNLATNGEFRPAQGLFVSGDFFDGLGVSPHIGRLISNPDDVRGCATPGAVLSYRFWQSRYGGDGGVIGQPVSLDGRRFEIIGVAADTFFGPEVGRTSDAAVPLCAEPMFRGTQSGLGLPDTWFLDTMARLKPGATIEGAQTQLASISPSIFAAHVSPRYTPDMAREFAQFTFTVTSARNGVSGLRRTYQTQLWVLFGVTGLVLLITCANLANLLLARATSREREMALRLAIGATRQRLVKQLLSEGLLIAGLGAASGIVVARWLSQSLVAFLNTQNARLFVDLSPDWRLFAFIVGIAVVACVLFGLSPALKASHTSPGQAMQAGGRSNTDSEERFNVRRALVVVQVGLSMVLIVGALLLSRSLRNLVTLDLGFRQNGVIAINVDTRQAALNVETRRAAYAQLMERVRAIPGVNAASEASVVPMSGSVWNQSVLIDGQKKNGLVYFNAVGVDYFRTMQTRLIAGRPFGLEDRLGATPTVVVNESFARKYFPGQSPIGRTFSLEAAPGKPLPQYQIIGLVEDAKYTDLREDFKPIGYFATAQDDDLGSSLDLVVHSDMALATLRPALTRTIRDVVPNATVAYNTIDMYVRDSLVTERLMAWLSGFFGLLGMVIATVGLYGVISYAVSRRKTEIGIRIALGADPRHVVSTVLSESAVLLGLGVAIGTVLALLATRWATSLLFGLTAWDPLSYAGAIAALFGVGLIAAWIPARRASRVAPTIALRAE